VIYGHANIGLVFFVAPTVKEHGWSA